MKRRIIAQIISSGKAYVFFLQEIKLSSCLDAMVRHFWPNKVIDFSISDSVGLSGGLIILWKAGEMEVLCSFRGICFLGLKVVWKNILYYIFNNYFGCSLALKRNLWSRL